MLIIPDKRLAAEIRWFTGLDDKETADLIEYFRALNAVRRPAPENFSADTFYSYLASLNFLVYKLRYTNFKNKADIKDAIFEINECFENMDIEAECEFINDDRDEACFPQVEITEFEYELNNYRSDIVKIIDENLSILPQEEYIELIGEIAKEYAMQYDEDEEQYYYNFYIIGDLLDNYELNIISHMETHKKSHT